MDELGLIKAIDRLGESVVVGIADAANRAFPPGAYVPATVPAQALRSVDWPVVRVVNHRQTTAVGWVLAASFISVRSA